MIYIEIPKYRIIPAPKTGIGWVEAQMWDDKYGAYRHIGIFRGNSRAEKYIEQLINNGGETK